MIQQVYATTDLIHNAKNTYLGFFLPAVIVFPLINLLISRDYMESDRFGN